MKPIHQILIQPLLTEKSVQQSAVKKYIFEVALDANKIEIAHAVEELFAKDKVKVATVNTMHVRGKERRSMGKKRAAGNKTGTSPAWKKAIVTLAADSPNIPSLEGA